jgi:hypothetical protein
MGAETTKFVLAKEAPCGPVAPVAPAGPCGPAGPVAPAGPAGPAAPVSPLAPDEPAAPASPLAPAGPAGPAGPGAPAAPAVPACAESGSVYVLPFVLQSPRFTFRSPLFSADPDVCTQTFRLVALSDAVADLTTETAPTASATADAAPITSSRPPRPLISAPSPPPPGALAAAIPAHHSGRHLSARVLSQPKEHASPDTGEVAPVVASTWEMAPRHGQGSARSR